MICMLVRWGSLLGGLNKPTMWNDPYLYFSQKMFGLFCFIMVVNVEEGGWVADSASSDQPRVWSSGAYYGLSIVVYIQLGI